ncbi:hypothetical protein HMPREF3173_10285 [Pseudomonas sp. HMSC08G10]|uniref:hypothetical protein n=1 Tax=Pseudomonas sp. HMSC08G10 TaxID=1581141 RepID=UPI0008A581DA|nr:hypothetical protein [Pseudomonas sp. HMSC08G10]OFS73864.1 hypothetical protein HMPREF3173_10285 [Pseudomonas sp. HMSC08G10]
MSKETGGPAFPAQINNGGNAAIKGFNGEEIKPYTFSAYPGMTLRDYFAAKAMHGTMAAMDSGERNYTPPETIAKNAYELADAMLAARVKP